MKTAERVLDYESNLSGERVAMTLDANATAHIMSVLTELYSNPQLAVIREYSTNARDAHIDAGVPQRPIEVQTPSPLSPYFKVRDYGEGLNADDIREIYSRYGTSTKRQSNAVVGMLGLGCKSALAYTDQFTLVGIKDGHKTTVSVSRDENGAGTMTIVAETDTTEESGVEVVVPAKSQNTFHEEAKFFFGFWDEGTVLLNGEKPKRIDGRWIAPDICLTTELDNDYIVMGNVAYPRSNKEDSYSRRYAQFNTVCFVPIGAVNFTPAREALQFTKQTKETLAALDQRIVKVKQDALTKMIAEAPTHWEAVAVAAEARTFGLTGKPLYKDEEVVTALRRSTDESAGTNRFLSCRGTKYNGVRDGVVTMQVPTGGGTGYVFVVGFDALSFTPYKRRKLEHWLAQPNCPIERPANFIFVDDLTPDERKWLDPKTIIRWAPIDAIDLPKEVKSSDGKTRLRGSYDAYVDGTHTKEIPAQDLEDSITDGRGLYWIHGNEWSSGIYNWERTNMVESWLGAKRTIVTLPKNRIDKFKRDFPNAKEFMVAMKDAGKKWIDKIPEDTVNAIRAKNLGVADMTRLDASRIDDPEVVELIRLLKIKTEDVTNRLSQLRRTFYITVDKTEKSYPDPMNKYPLVNARYGNTGRIAVEHTYLYMNAVYAMEQQKAQAAA